MSIYKEPEIEGYWHTGPISPYHPVRDWMSLCRFKALHRRFRISDPAKDSLIWEQVSVFLVPILYYISIS